MLNITGKIDWVNHSPPYINGEKYRNPSENKGFDVFLLNNR
jgi:hypothetical protein